MSLPIIANSVALWSVVPVGVLSADKIFVTMRNFWIGDTLGMITNFSAMTAAF
jgi:hypothetical protein